MSRAIVHSTQIGVTLSLNIIAATDGDTRLLTFPLIRLTSLVFCLWTLWQKAGRFWLELMAWYAALLALVEALGMVARIYLTWAGIVTVSMKYGVGL